MGNNCINAILKQFLYIFLINFLINFDSNFATEDYNYDEYDSDYNSTDFEPDFSNKTTNSSLSFVDKSFELNSSQTVNKVNDEKNLTFFKNKTNFINSDNDIQSDIEYNHNDSEEENSLSVVNQFFDSLMNNEEEEEKNDFSNETQGLKSDNELVIEKLISLYKNLNNNFKPLHKQIAQRLIELLFSSDLSPDCLAAFARINDALNRRKLWAFKCKKNICCL